MKAPKDPKREKNLNNPFIVEAICLALEKHGRVKIRVWGKSMFPIIWPGANLWFKKCSIEDLVLGDVALVKSGTGLIAHRVTHIEEDCIYLQGDAYPQKDQSVPKEFILGKVDGLALGYRTINLPRSLLQSINLGLLCATPFVRSTVLQVREILKKNRN